jgi:hypothetical protein
MRDAENTTRASIYLDGVLVELNKQKVMFFNKNSVPLHFNNIVRCARNVRFLNLWIGRGAPTLRPLCIEDLIAAFFLSALVYKMSGLRRENTLINLAQTSRET